MYIVTLHFLLQVNLKHEKVSIMLFFQLICETTVCLIWGFIVTLVSKWMVTSLNEKPFVYLCLRSRYCFVTQVYSKCYMVNLNCVCVMWERLTVIKTISRGQDIANCQFSNKYSIRGKSSVCILHCTHNHAVDKPTVSRHPVDRGTDCDMQSPPPKKKKKKVNTSALSPASNGIHCSSLICVFFMLITPSSHTSRVWGRGRKEGGWIQWSSAARVICNGWWMSDSNK